MPRQRGTTTIPQQPESLLEQLHSSTTPKEADATGPEQNCKRDSAKPTADPGDDGRVDIAQRGAIATRRCPVHEKLGSRVFESFCGCQAAIFGWTIERVQPVNVLAFDAQHLSARRQYVCMGCLADKAFGQRCHDVDHVLATVEHQEDLPFTNKSQQASEWVPRLRHEPECRPDG